MRSADAARRARKGEREGKVARLGLVAIDDGGETGARERPSNLPDGIAGIDGGEHVHGHSPLLDAAHHGRVAAIRDEARRERDIASRVRGAEREPAAGLEHAVALRKEELRVRDVLEHEIAHHEVEGPALEREAAVRPHLPELVQERVLGGGRVDVDPDHSLCEPAQHPDLAAPLDRVVAVLAAPAADVGHHGALRQQRADAPVERERAVHVGEAAEARLGIPAQHRIRACLLLDHPLPLHPPARPRAGSASSGVISASHGSAAAGGQHTTRPHMARLRIRRRLTRGAPQQHEVDPRRRRGRRRKK